MTTQVYPIEVPSGSEIARLLPGAYFHDSYEVHVKPEEASSPALAFALRTFSEMPGWVGFLMKVRNRVGGLVGLKNLGAFNDMDKLKPLQAYRVGDRVGIFSLRYVSENEVILGDSDKHLDVRVSVCKSTRASLPAVAVSTVVHVHNGLGKFYMFFVAPAHKLIAPASLRRN